MRTWPFLALLACTPLKKDLVSTSHSWDGLEGAVATWTPLSSPA